MFCGLYVVVMSILLKDCKFWFCFCIFVKWIVSIDLFGYRLFDLIGYGYGDGKFLSNCLWCGRENYKEFFLVVKFVEDFKVFLWELKLMLGIVLDLKGGVLILDRFFVMCIFLNCMIKCGFWIKIIELLDFKFYVCLSIIDVWKFVDYVIISKEWMMEIE